MREYPTFSWIYFVLMLISCVSGLVGSVLSTELIINVLKDNKPAKVYLEAARMCVWIGGIGSLCGIVLSSIGIVLGVIW